MNNPHLSLFLRAPANSGFVKGSAGVPSSPSRPSSASVSGTVEVRTTKPLKTQWIKISLMKQERLPVHAAGGASFTSEVLEPVILWQSNDDRTLLDTRDLEFNLPLPLDSPPSTELRQGGGSIQYWLEVTMQEKGKKKGLLRKEVAALSRYREPIPLTTHNLHPSWPIYSVPKHHHFPASSDLDPQNPIPSFPLEMRLTQLQTAYGPSDLILLPLVLAIPSSSAPLPLDSIQLTLLESAIFRSSEIEIQYPEPTYRVVSQKPTVVSLSRLNLDAGTTLMPGEGRAMKWDLRLMVPPALGVGGVHGKEGGVGSTVRGGKHIEVEFTLKVEVLGQRGEVVRAVEGIEVVIDWLGTEESRSIVHKIGPVPQLEGRSSAREGGGHGRSASGGSSTGRTSVAMRSISSLTSHSTAAQQPRVPLASSHYQPTSPHDPPYPYSSDNISQTSFPASAFTSPTPSSTSMEPSLSTDLTLPPVSSSSPAPSSSASQPRSSQPKRSSFLVHNPSVSSRLYKGERTFADTPELIAPPSLNPGLTGYGFTSTTSYPSPIDGPSSNSQSPSSILPTCSSSTPPPPTRAFPTAEEEKARLFAAAQAAVRKNQGDAPFPESQHPLSSSTSTASTVPPSQVDKPSTSFLGLGYGHPSSSEVPPQQPPPALSSLSTQPAPATRSYPTAEEEKAALFARAQEAVGRTHRIASASSVASTSNGLSQSSASVTTASKPPFSPQEEQARLLAKARENLAHNQRVASASSSVPSASTSALMSNPTSSPSPPQQWESAEDEKRRLFESATYQVAITHARARGLPPPAPPPALASRQQPRAVSSPSPPPSLMPAHANSTGRPDSFASVSSLAYLSSAQNDETGSSADRPSSVLSTSKRNAFPPKRQSLMLHSPPPPASIRSSSGSSFSVAAAVAKGPPTFQTDSSIDSHRQRNPPAILTTSSPRASLDDDQTPISHRQTTFSPSTQYPTAEQEKERLRYQDAVAARDRAATLANGSSSSPATSPSHDEDLTTPRASRPHPFPSLMTTASSMPASSSSSVGPPPPLSDQQQSVYPSAAEEKQRLIYQDAVTARDRAARNGRSDGGGGSRNGDEMERSYSSAGAYGREDGMGGSGQDLREGGGQQPSSQHAITAHAPGLSEKEQLRLFYAAQEAVTRNRSSSSSTSSQPQPPPTNDSSTLSRHSSITSLSTTSTHHLHRDPTISLGKRRALVPPPSSSSSIAPSSTYASSERTLSPPPPTHTQTPLSRFDNGDLSPTPMPMPALPAPPPPPPPPLEYALRYTGLERDDVRPGL